MPYAYEMNKFLMLPNADHVVAGWCSLISRTFKYKCEL